MTSTHYSKISITHHDIAAPLDDWRDRMRDVVRWHDHGQVVANRRTGAIVPVILGSVDGALPARPTCVEIKVEVVSV